MIATPGNCFHTWSCNCSTTMTITSTGSNVAPNQITSINYSARSGNQRSAKSALELERELRRFEKLAKWKPKRPNVKVDEKRLIAKPTRSHAKPHQSQSSRAAISVRQFAARVK